MNANIPRMLSLKADSSLQAVYPFLLDHAIRHFHARDVLRFLQRRVNCNFQGEVKSSFKVRVEGTRIKHWVEENSIKMYDKQGSVLRVETTMNNPRRWRVWRRTTRKGKRCMAWIPMRKSIADIKRRAEICLSANARYLDTLSVVGDPTPACKILDPLAKDYSKMDDRIVRCILLIPKMLNYFRSSVAANSCFMAFVIRTSA